MGRVWRPASLPNAVYPPELGRVARLHRCRLGCRSCQLDYQVSSHAPIEVFSWTEISYHQCSSIHLLTLWFSLRPVFEGLSRGPSLSRDSCSRYARTRIFLIREKGLLSQNALKDRQVLGLPKCDLDYGRGFALAWFIGAEASVHP